MASTATAGLQRSEVAHLPHRAEAAVAAAPRLQVGGTGDNRANRSGAEGNTQGERRALQDGREVQARRTAAAGAGVIRIAPAAVPGGGAGEGPIPLTSAAWSGISADRDVAAKDAAAIFTADAGFVALPGNEGGGLDAAASAGGRTMEEAPSYRRSEAAAAVPPLPLTDAENAEHSSRTACRPSTSGCAACRRREALAPSPTPSHPPPREGIARSPPCGTASGRRIQGAAPPPPRQQQLPAEGGHLVREERDAGGRLGQSKQASSYANHHHHLAAASSPSRRTCSTASCSGCPLATQARA